MFTENILYYLFEFCIQHLRFIQGYTVNEKRIQTSKNKYFLHFAFALKNISVFL